MKIKNNPLGHPDSRQITYDESDAGRMILHGFPALRVKSDGTGPGTVVEARGLDKQWTSLDGVVAMAIDAPENGYHRLMTITIANPITNINGALVVEVKDES